MCIWTNLSRFVDAEFNIKSGEVRAMISIKSPENRFDLSLCLLCGQTLMKTTISALTSK